MTILAGIPYDSRIFHRVSQCTLSNAFLKSMKLINRGVFHSKHCSMIFRNLKIWSIHPRPFLNPACSCLSLMSIAQSCSGVLYRRPYWRLIEGLWAGSSGSGRLSTSWKCWTHLSACFFSVVKSLPFLSFTGADWLMLLPQNMFCDFIHNIHLAPCCSFLSFTSQLLN